MAYNEKYNYFAEYISEFVGKNDIRNLTKEFQKNQYTNKPEGILTNLNDFFMTKWDENAEPSPRTGNSKTQKRNFESFIKKTLISREKMTFDNPYSREKNAIDFSPLFSRYRELSGEFVDKPKISLRIQKLVTITRPKGEIGEEYTQVAPSVFFKRTENQIELSEKGNHVDNLIALRDAMRDLSFAKEKDRPIDTLKAYELYKKADKALETHYKDTSRFGIKSPEELRNALLLRGGNISGLDTSDKLKDAAKKAGIGLRKYQLTREELIDDITKISSYDKEDFDKSPNSFLKELRKNLKRELRKPKRKFYLNRDDFPENTEKLVEFYKERGKEFTVKEKSEIKSKVKKIFPFLSTDEINAETNQRLASRIVDVPIIDKEIEKRYMKWKYDNENKAPTFKDLIGMSKVTNTEFKLEMSLKMERIPDPNRPGKTKFKKEYIPQEAFRAYRNKLKDTVSRAQNIISEKSEQQERQFIEQGISEGFEEASAEFE